jgi:hypothetical protein
MCFTRDGNHLISYKPPSAREVPEDLMTEDELEEQSDAEQNLFIQYWKFEFTERLTCHLSLPLLGIPIDTSCDTIPQQMICPFIPKDDTETTQYIKLANKISSSVQSFEHHILQHFPSFGLDTLRVHITPSIKDSLQYNYVLCDLDSEHRSHMLSIFPSLTST